MELADVEKHAFRKLLSNPKTLAANLCKISPDDFSSPFARKVIAALGNNGIIQNYSPNKNYFTIILRDTFREQAELEQAVAMLVGIAKDPVDASDLDLLLKEIRSNRMCRELTRIMKDSLPHINPSEIEETYNALLRDMLKLPLSISSGVSVATIREVHEALEERVLQYTNEALQRFPTGIIAFDQAIGGFAPGEFIVICAGTGQGKSNVMLWWAEKYLQMGANVLFVTIEMSYAEMMTRYHAMATGFDVCEIGNRRIPPDKLGEYYAKLIAHAKAKEERKAFMQECSTILLDTDPKNFIEISKKYKNRTNKFFVVDLDSANPGRVEREIQRIAMDHRIDYVFVDFINVMDPEYHNRDKVKELASVSRDLKKVARKTNTILFSAAQLDTTSLKNKQDEKITPDRVKYARAISENCDWMVAFNRTDEDNRLKQLRLQLAKHRHSSDCTALLEFDFATLQAMDLGSYKGEQKTYMESDE